MHCQLCGADGPDLTRISGVDICGTCRTVDGRQLLLDHGIVCDWNVMLGWLSASIALPPRQHSFVLKCVPEGLHHKLIKLLVHEVEVGDPAFDDNVFIRTSDPERAAAVLANEGVQSALVSLLSRRSGDNRGPAPKISLDGSTLSARVRTEGPLGSPASTEACLELVALALHLSGASSQTTSEHRAAK